jgi:hypothetical protein
MWRGGTCTRVQTWIYMTDNKSVPPFKMKVG